MDHDMECDFCCGPATMVTTVERMTDWGDAPCLRVACDECAAENRPLNWPGPQPLDERWIKYFAAPWNYDCTPYVEGEL